VTGEVVTAANVNSFLMNQAVIQTTSGARPASPPAGMMIYQTDTNTFAVYGTTWCEITPYQTTVATSETTTSASFVALTTALTFTITTGTKLLLTMSAIISNNGANNTAEDTYAISGATTTAAAAFTGCYWQQPGVSQNLSLTKTTNLTVTAGANVVTEKATTSAGTATFRARTFTGVSIPT